MSPELAWFALGVAFGFLAAFAIGAAWIIRQVLKAERRHQDLYQADQRARRAQPTYLRRVR